MKVYSAFYLGLGFVVALQTASASTRVGGRPDQIGHHVVEQLRSQSLRKALELSPHLREVLNTFRTNGKTSNGGASADETDLLQGFYYLAGKDPTAAEEFSADLPNLEHATEVENELHARLNVLEGRIKGMDPGSKRFARVAVRESEKLFGSWDSEYWTFAEDLKPTGQEERLAAGGAYQWPIYDLPPAAKTLTQETYQLFHSAEFGIFDPSISAIRAVFKRKHQLMGDDARSALVSYVSHLNYLMDEVFPRALDALKKEKKKWFWQRSREMIRLATDEISDRLDRVSMLLVGGGAIDRLIEESGAGEAEAERLAGEYRAASIRLRDHQHELTLDAGQL